MKYEMKKIEIDPFDIMCGECVEHEIEYFVEVTEEELREEHQDQIGADYSMPEWEKERLIEEGNWHPTPDNFEDWLNQEIEAGFIRIA